MEMILDLYQYDYDPEFPVVCFDECSRQILKDVRKPLPMRPGDILRHDYEYEREGVANLFVMVEPLTGWRRVNVTEHRKYKDFAKELQYLADVQYPDATRIFLVVDNLNIHSFTSLWVTFKASEALRLSRRFEFIYTPKHASWLNMAEIEISALHTQCLRKRFDSRDHMAREVEAWQDKRNKRAVSITWQFTPDVAREKMARHYPDNLID